ncbi:T9SS type A sorting domain-containing protein [Labilibacter marinus]|uniref:T9SS type A sorting domain-containing protein n=1 Tax=Labilibacter marinus TaxID=1477105 RepID=UPI00094FE499|nr:T9SS type A sorting domain-containing protein [Labilibacter marinus]
MKKVSTLFILCLLISNVFAKQHTVITENFFNPQFYSEKFFLFNTDGTTDFVRSNNTDFEWGGYAIKTSDNWAPIGYLFSDNATSSRNCLCFLNESESAGAYAYCQFDSSADPLNNDSLIGLSSVKISMMDDAPEDKLGIMIKDANGNWFYSSIANSILAIGSEKTFNIKDFVWMKVSATLSSNLDNHTDISNGIGDITQGAVTGTPDLDYITGGGVIIHEGVVNDLNLRISAIEWLGQTPAGTPVLIEPVNNSTVTQLNTILKWDVEGEETYTYDVWFAKDGESLTKVASAISAKQWDVDNLADLSTYKWKIDAIDADDKIIQGEEWDFYVEKGMPTFFNDLKNKTVASVDSVVWKQFGPGMAGYCEEFWCHPTDENVMFQSPDMYNSYGTWDNGQSWHTIKNCDGTGVYMRRVQSITFSHQDPNFGMAIDVRGYLYQTTDMGHNWEYQATKNFGGRHCELAVDPSNDDIWYMGAGDFWNVKANHRSLASFNDPSQGYIYKYAQYGHLYKSTNKGETWTKITDNFAVDTEFGKIIVDPRNSNHVIAITNYGIFRSSNQGLNWTASTSGLPHHFARDMDYYYNETDDEFILYTVLQTTYSPQGSTVTSEGGIYKSTDGGVNWTSITGNAALDLTRVTSYTTRDKYHNAIGYWFGVDKATAKNTYPTYPSSILPVYNRLRVNPNNKNEIYIANNVKHDRTFGAGDVWKTTDGGNTWFATARSGKYWIDGQDNSYWSSRNCPTGTNTTYAHLQHEMDIREETWGNRFLEINKDGEVFICLDQQILRSNNNGSSWEQVDDFETETGSHAWVGRGASNLPGRFMLLETGKPGRKFFCSGEHGLWESSPIGTFADKTAVAVKQIEGQVNAGGAHSIASVAVHPTNPDEIYILMFRQSHRGQFRKSTDGGKTWFNVSKPVNWTANESGDMMFQYNLTVDYTNPENIYFVMPENAITEVSSNNVPDGFNDFGIYKSSNGGVSWTIEDTGLPADASVSRLKMHPENSSTLYAALNESKTGVAGGLYKSTDKGANWHKMTIPSVIKAVNNIHIDKTTKDLYISCGRYIGSFEEGGVWKSTDNGASWKKIFYLPWIWQAETSPINPDIILVNAAMPHESQGGSLFNPGAYVSLDGGATWRKVNKNLGQPNTIVDLRPDPDQEGVYWCALKGSGWARAIEKGVIVNEYTPEDGDDNSIIEETGKETITLYPNPVRNQCIVEFELTEPDDVQLNILDINGRKVISKNEAALIGANKIVVNTNQLSTGVYILNVKVSGDHYFKKFIKK